jgi:thiol-disulfide isomerase/thioredoxin
MTGVTKWALGVGVVVIAVIAAFLPARDSVTSIPQTTAVTVAREKANLKPCPSHEGELRGFSGVTAACLASDSQVDLGKALAGRVTLVNVWASWCQACTEELPVLNAYAQQPDSVQVLTVQVASKPEDGLTLLTRLGVHLPAIYDGAGQTGPVREKLALPANLPASYLIRSDGEFHLIDNPRVFSSVDQVRAAVTPS